VFTQALVEAQWHGALDVYGSFCLTIPLGQVYDMVGALRDSNSDWDRRAKSDPYALRGLDVRQLSVPYMA
jgi:hypothetical protein